MQRRFGYDNPAGSIIRGFSVIRCFSVMSTRVLLTRPTVSSTIELQTTVVRLSLSRTTVSTAAALSYNPATKCRMSPGHAAVSSSDVATCTCA